MRDPHFGWIEDVQFSSDPSSIVIRVKYDGGGMDRLSEIVLNNIDVDRSSPQIMLEKLSELSEDVHVYVIIDNCIELIVDDPKEFTKFVWQVEMSCIGFDFVRNLYIFFS